MQKRLNWSRCHLGWGLGWAKGTTCLLGVQIPYEKGQFWEKGSPIVKYRDFLPWAVQKWLNWSICCLGCGLGWTEGSTSSIVFNRWCQCAHMGGTLAPPGEYDWTLRLQQQSGLMLNYFYHMLLLIIIFMIFTITSLAISRRENITTTSWLTNIEYKITITTIRH